jgi:hypothetical protein
LFLFYIKHSKAVLPLVDERAAADGVELLEEDLGDPGLVLSRRVAAHNTVLVSLPFCNSRPCFESSVADPDLGLLDPDPDLLARGTENPFIIKQN